MRLNRFLASCGLGSRRSAEGLIAGGRVAVNGEPALTPAISVDPAVDRVTVDGRPVSPPVHHTYYLLHKPEGVVTTVRDPGGRPTVVDLVPRTPRVFPVGRLDQETSGALLLTDDGDLAHHLLHPRYHIEKEYDVLARGTVEDATLTALRTGIRLENETRPTAPAGVRVASRARGRTHLIMVLHEGRNRQIRRMLEAVGHPVIQLRRIRIGPVLLGNLAPGAWRELGREELAALRRRVQEARHDALRSRKRGS